MRCHVCASQKKTRNKTERDHLGRLIRRCKRCFSIVTKYGTPSYPVVQK